MQTSQVQAIDAALRLANVLGLRFVGISLDCVSIHIILHIMHAFSCTLAIIRDEKVAIANQACRNCPYNLQVLYPGNYNKVYTP